MYKHKVTGAFYSTFCNRFSTQFFGLQML